MRDIGKNIRDLRQHHNMTQDTLAEKLFVTRQTVSNYETGRTRPDVEMVMRIAEVLNTDANAILYGIPTPPERKADIKKLLIAGSALAILIPIYIRLGTITDYYKTNKYIIWPKMLWAMFMTPSLFLLLGWTLMQAVGTFTKLKPVKNRIIAAVMLGFLAFYLAVQVPFAISILSGFQLPEIWQYIGYGLLGALPYKISPPDPTVVFLILGILMWQIRFPKQKKVAA